MLLCKDPESNHRGMRRLELDIYCIRAHTYCCCCNDAIEHCAKCRQAESRADRRQEGDVIG